MKVESIILDFLKDLAINNNREWFYAEEKRYKKVKETHEKVVEDLLNQFSLFENMDGVKVKNCTYRIARDVRFSKDKSPYKNWFSSSYSEGGRSDTKHDYYLHIQPHNQSFLGAGLYAPTSEQLAKLRQEIDYNPNDLKDIIFDKTFVQYFGNPKGSSLKTSPKGYEKNHPEIELLRMNQLFFSKSFSDNELMADDFTAKVIESAKVLKPFTDYLNLIFN